jgi:hypothetical protein
VSPSSPAGACAAQVCRGRSGQRQPAGAGGRRTHRREAEAKDQGLQGDALLAYRQQHAAPRLTALQDWLQRLGLKALKNSGLAKAVNHALGRSPALLRYLEDGGRPIDNNPIEDVAASAAILPRAGPIP